MADCEGKFCPLNPEDCFPASQLRSQAVTRQNPLREVIGASHGWDGLRERTANLKTICKYPEQLQAALDQTPEHFD